MIFLISGDRGGAGRRRRFPQSLFTASRAAAARAGNLASAPADIALIMTASTVCGRAHRADFTGAIADVLGRKRVIAAAMVALVHADHHDGAVGQPGGDDLLALRAGAAAAADLRRHGRLYRRRKAGRRGDRHYRHLCIGGRPSAAFSAASSRVCSRTRSAGAGVSRRRRAHRALRHRRDHAAAARAAIRARRELHSVARQMLRASAAIRNWSRPTRSASACCSTSSRYSLTSISCSPRRPSICLRHLSRLDLRRLSARHSAHPADRARGVGFRAAPFRHRASSLYGWAGAILLTLVPSLPAIIVGLAIAAACGFVCQASSTSYVAIRAKTGHVLGGRALCDVLLCRRQRRRVASRPRLARLEMARHRGSGAHHAGHHDADRVAGMEQGSAIASHRQGNANGPDHCLRGCGFCIRVERYGAGREKNRSCPRTCRLKPKPVSAALTTQRILRRIPNSG